MTWIWNAQLPHWSSLRMGLRTARLSCLTGAREARAHASGVALRAIILPFWLPTCKPTLSLGYDFVIMTFSKWADVKTPLQFNLPMSIPFLKSYLCSVSLNFLGFLKIVFNHFHIKLNVVRLIYFEPCEFVFHFQPTVVARYRMIPKYLSNLLQKYLNACAHWGNISINWKSTQSTIFVSTTVSIWCRNLVDTDKRYSFRHAVFSFVTFWCHTVSKTFSC